MNLKQLKLAGFKSFVDPTVIPFPSQLVAVVGPNGCGKSNIIDAVRWVMGESSAKTLRGDSMMDVIFNGSANRKAVGQASVELIFDNSLGRITGQYASYQEISVKRAVNRNGESTYFLNGARCRRCDITDIFLGTGAGSKGYSIIGQGTISKIIEARPEELRAYLEEAAGISKYKERRKETVSRISHTRENLARVADIREELERQLQRLERQAKTAERYQILKEEEALIKAEILALKWQGLQEEQDKVEQEIQQQQLTWEKFKANIALIYQQNVNLREQVHSVNETFTTQQTSFYQLNTEIARLEEHVQQQQREKQRLHHEKQQLQQQWQTLHSQQLQDQEQNAHSNLAYQQSEQQIIRLRGQLQQQEQQLQQQQQGYDQWHRDYQETQSKRQQTLNEQKLNHMKLQHLNQRRQEMQSRMEVVQRDQQQLDMAALQNQLNHLQLQASQAQEQVQVDEQNYQQHSQHSKALLEQLQETEKSIRRQHDQGYQITTRLAAVTALVQTALGRQAGQENAAWQDKQRVVENLVVEPKWQAACEMVLQEGLHAIVVESLASLQQEIAAIQQDFVFVVAHNSKSSQQPFPSLADKIKGVKPQWPVCVDKIFTADTLDEAMTWWPQLSNDESIITPQGYWLGHNFVKIKRLDKADHPNLLAHQQELLTLQQQSASADAQLQVLVAQRDEYHHVLTQEEGRQTALQHQVNLSREALRIAQAEIEACQRLLKQTLEKEMQLASEQSELIMKLEDNASEIASAELALQTSEQQSSDYENGYQQLEQQKAGQYERLLLVKNTVDELRTTLHQQELQATREQLSAKQINERIQRTAAELQDIEGHLQQIASQLAELENPDSQIQTLLQEKLTQQQQAENALTTLREQLSSHQQQVEHLDGNLKNEEKNAAEVQQLIQQKQMEGQALKVRAITITEALKEVGMQPREVLTLMPEGATVVDREQLLLETVNKINRLGAINLAAIEEYQQQLERKNYLDAQYNDLNEAIAVLEAAIEKMDKETRQRFQATFEEVNTAFQNLFPRLFGGGHALLTLNCDNLLEAGVLVMAQPPGKRNSTIHLLSGGEKAMTAVALIFAIFQLNPSPFCMLDEVDAPLDDVNVGRFCALVKEMSQVVQFLFITHNKLTMELADHLIGVTMREPGVSRMVAVDVEQALSMSES